MPCQCHRLSSALSAMTCGWPITSALLAVPTRESSTWSWRSDPAGPMTTALVFPGQGAQFVGMGQDLYNAHPVAQKTLDEANSVLGFDLKSLCFSGPKDLLTDTINAQPAILAVSVAALRVLRASGDLEPPAWVAGHSMGEYSALVAAGALEFADALRLVRERGRLMKEAGERSPGGMAAVLGLDDATVDDICRVAGTEVANYNAPGQIVISGVGDALQQAMDAARQRGARRVVRLAVSIGAHSRLMQEAVGPFSEAVHRTPFRQARIPVVANVTARPITAISDIRSELIQQLMASVRWVASVKYMVERGVTHFIEVGPGKVLTGLIKRIAPGIEVVKYD